MRTIICCFLLWSSLNLHAQKKNVPVDWRFEVNQIENNIMELKATATLDKGWYIYSQFTGEGGPIATSFTYDERIIPIGKTEEISSAIKKMSDLFEIEVIKFKGEAVFVQKFKVPSTINGISGSVRFMCCDSDRCLPPTDVPFEVSF